MEKLGHLQMTVFDKRMLNRCGIVLADDDLEIIDRGNIKATIPNPELVTMVTLKELNAAAREAGWLVSLDVEKDAIHFMDIEA